MDTQIDHTHMGIKTCIENDQNESACVRTWTTNKQCTIIKMESVYNKEHKTYHMHYQTEIKIV